MTKRTKKKAARRSTPPKKQRRSAPCSGAAVRVVLLGAPIELVYRHAHGGTYRHKFGRRARVSSTPDGRHLVIDGINVKQFIEG